MDHQNDGNVCVFLCKCCDINLNGAHTKRVAVEWEAKMTGLIRHTMKLTNIVQPQNNN